jgi:hypothetical protein
MMNKNYQKKEAEQTLLFIAIKNSKNVPEKMKVDALDKIKKMLNHSRFEFNDVSYLEGAFSWSGSEIINAGNFEFWNTLEKFLTNQIFLTSNN